MDIHIQHIAQYCLKKGTTYTKPTSISLCLEKSDLEAKNMMPTTTVLDIELTNISMMENSSEKK